MFKRLRNFSCFLSVVHANGEIKADWGPYTDLAVARDGTVVNEAVIGETFSELDGY